MDPNTAIRLQNELIEAKDELIERLKSEIRELKQRKRSRSPSPVRRNTTVSRDAIHLSNVASVDTEKLQSELERQYGQLRDFMISRDNQWGRVVFESSDKQTKCLEDASYWESEFPGLRIQPHKYRR